MSLSFSLSSSASSRRFFTLPIHLLLALLVFCLSTGWSQLQGENEGVATVLTYDSADHGPVSYWIYTPPGYYSPGNEERYPVLYFLHGSGDDELALSDALNELPTTGDSGPEKMDDAVLSGLLPPMIMVAIGAPGGGSWDETLGRLVAEEMTAHIDRNWRTIADRRGRSLEGFSSGGLGVARYLTSRAERFASASILGGGFENYRWSDHADSLRVRGLRVNVLSGTLDQFLADARDLRDVLAAEGIEHQFSELAGVPHNSNAIYEAAGLANLQFHAATWAAEQVVDAGPDLVIDGGAPATVSVTGRVLDGGTYSTDWEQIEGPTGAVTFNNSFAVGTSVTFDAIGTYALRFSATDAVGTYDDVLTVSVVDLTDSLEMHLPFDGDAQDVTGNGHDGVEFGGAGPISAGKVGGAYEFDGVDDTVVVPDFGYGPQFSVAFWFRPDDLVGNSYQYLWSHNGFNASNSLNAYLPETSTSWFGQLRSVLRDGNDPNGNFIDAAGDYGDGGWHHYTIAVGDGGSRVYIDGREMVVSSQGGDAIDPGTDVVLGGRSVSPANRYFDGCLDEVRFYSRRLQPAEAYALGNTVGADLAPVVDAGEDVGIQEVEDAFLTATVADEGASPLTFSWTRVSGPGSVAFSHPDSPSSSATFETPGVYVLRLTASDAQGSGSDTVTVSIQASSAPVGHWRFNETSGTIADDSSLQGNDGTLIGSAGLPTWTDGGLFFDWTDSQRVNLGRPASLDLDPATTDLSLVAWIKVSPGAEGTIISKAYGSLVKRQFQLYLYDAENDGRSSIYGLVGGMSNNNAKAAVVDDDQWHLVAVVHDKDTLRNLMYVDGQPVGDWKASGTATNTVDVMIGARRANSSNTGIGWTFDGEIGEARIYSWELSPEEMTALFLLGPG